ncbi:MAG: GNAT family N-acetyltransferase [Vicinamibacterales bacterium]
MEKIFRNAQPRPPAATSPRPAAPLVRPWREAPPLLTGALCTLREPVGADAPSLLMALGAEDLRELAPQAPTPTITGVEAFVADLQDRRSSGAAAAWAIVPRDAQAPVGLLVVRGLDHAFTMVAVTAVVAAEFRGTGLFQDAAATLLDLLFGAMGVHRIEVRVDVRNARANGALRKLGATQEGVLRQAERRDGGFRDHVLWGLVAADWAAQRDFEPTRIH